MAPSTRIPPLLQPCLELPHEESLLLLTSTLGASANWLLVRLLSNAFGNNGQSSGDTEGHNVVLVSWMREYDFWKQEARKSAGLDLESMRRAGRLAFVDGLSELCTESLASQTSDISDPISTARSKPYTEPSVAPDMDSQIQRSSRALPVRGSPSGVVPARLPAIARSTNPAPTPAPPNTSASQTHTGHYVLKSPNTSHLTNTISSAISALASSPSMATDMPGRRTLLVLDNPDLLLALSPTLTAAALNSSLLALHKVSSVSHILTHIHSDDPLLSLSSPPQPLELSQHNFLIKYAHMSRRILGVRVLDTGVAKDVSGVIRITEQKADWLGIDLASQYEEVDTENKRGKEFLYQVKGDGSVRVFERGAGGEG